MINHDTTKYEVEINIYIYISFSSTYSAGSIQSEVKIMMFLYDLFGSSKARSRK